MSPDVHTLTGAYALDAVDDVETYQAWTERLPWLAGMTRRAVFSEIVGLSLS